MSAQTVDAASLTIDALRLVLPARRKEWGDAARSELATLTSRSERRSFSVSCLRVVVSDRATLRNVCAAVLVTVLLVVAAISTADISGLATRVVGIGLVAALAALFLLARRSEPRGRFGDWVAPVGPGRAHGAVRAVGSLVSTVLMLAIVLDSRTTAGLGPGTGTGRSTGPVELAVVGLIALAMAASLLAITAKSAATSPRVVGVGGACGVITGLGWFGLVLAAGYVQPETLARAALVSILGCAVVAGVVVAVWGRPTSDDDVRAGLLAAVVAILLIFTAPMATYVLVPSTVPDPNPGSYSPQLNQYAHDEQDAIEAGDPYVLPFLAGGLLSLLLLGSVGARRRQSEVDSSEATVEVVARPAR